MLHLYAIYTLLILRYVNGYDKKSSLTFVIDDTGSMADDINQVKIKTKDVFDAVLTSNASRIDDFILVTFNDPGVQLRTITKDSYVFKSALDSIYVNGGNDCPEYAMTGIELALEQSKPNSFLYVFTDASAKDYGKIENVKTLSQKKSTQVSFLLTGDCGNINSNDFLVYDKLAVATSGQVFHIAKHDIHAVIDYIIASIKHKETILGQKFFENGLGKKLWFNVDSKEWDVHVSVSATNPIFDVFDSDGNLVNTEIITNTAKTNIRKLGAGGTRPGAYYVNLNSNSGTSVKVTASTSVSFQHGFSVIKPASLNETATMPVPGEKSYLSIALENQERDVTLDTAVLRDMNDNVLMKLPLTVINTKQQFYTTEPFDPPKVMFKIEVHGYTNAKENITRISPTTVEPQKPVTLTYGITKKKPMVNILADENIKVDYEQLLVVRCKIHGFPKPDVIWEGPSDAVEPSVIVPVDLPYDYMSVLTINKVTQNSTVTCKAVNSEGHSSDSAKIELKNYFIVLEYPKDVTIDYGNSMELKCRIDAFPPVSITWFQNNEKISLSDNFELSSDNSVLTIKNMDLKRIGEYSVKVVNEIIKKEFNFSVTTITEKPNIDKRMKYIFGEVGNPVSIYCKVSQGIPKPKISWVFNNDESSEAIDLNLTNETLYIENVAKDDAGNYKCSAANEIGEDNHVFELLVVYPPSIEDDRNYIDVIEDNTVKIICSVDGFPFPEIRWFKNSTLLSSTSKHRTYVQNILRFRASKEDVGDYTCEATNSLGKAERTVHLNVYGPVKIKLPEETILYVELGKPLTLACEADGHPEPEIKWTYDDFDNKILQQPLRAGVNNFITITAIQVEDEGFYKCTARNFADPVSITYEVHVLAYPTINNTLLNKYLNAVEGDLVLKIPCKAIGRPKPTVLWKVDGLNVALGTLWYDIDEEGTLFIKNISKHSVGIYKCIATNSLGSTAEEFSVTVHPYPIISSIPVKVLFEEGTPAKIECDLPHEYTDQLRWFKNGRFITNSSTLSWSAVSTSDSGSYSCRVSGFKSSHSSHKYILVGHRPTFNTTEETQIDFLDGSTVLLDCSASGEPIPKATWFHNGDKIKEKSMAHLLKMKVNDIGTYKCEISNEFGLIRRRFKIGSKECLLNIRDDFGPQQPLILTEGKRWPKLGNSDGYLRIPKKKRLLLLCPGSYLSDGKNNLGNKIKFTCIGNTIFNIKGKYVNFKDLTCDRRIKPLARGSGTFCSEGNTELLAIGFSLESEFLNIYDVCFDLSKKVPIYAKHKIDPTLANTIPKESPKEFTGSKYLPSDFGQIYRCESKCCWEKRLMVNPKDVAPGLPQLSTYNNLNTLPQWSTCGNAENWDEVERRVRALANFFNYGLSVWTGAYYNQTSDDTKIDLRSKEEKQPVPQFIWKVIQNLQEEKALAIIQVNEPDLTLEEAANYILCPDICNDIEWMRNSDWYDLSKGLTYCCSVSDFENAFDYKDLFKGPTNILNNARLIPEHALT